MPKPEEVAPASDYFHTLNHWTPSASSERHRLWGCVKAFRSGFVASWSHWQHSLLSSTVSIPGRATVVGFIELRDAPLQPGTLVEPGCKMKSGVASKCGLTACPKCSHRWRLYTFEGSTAGTFIMHNRSRPLKERMSLKSAIRHAPFRHPFVSVDGTANSQCAWGEPPEGPGKTLILDPRFGHHAVRPLHVLESSGLMEEPAADELELFGELNPEADDEDRHRFVGDGMCLRYVDPVARRTASRMKQYRFAKAVRRANAAVIPLPSMYRRHTARRTAGSEEGRSTVGSGGDASSTEASTGFLGGLIKFQAVVRRALGARVARSRGGRSHYERTRRDRAIADYFISVFSDGTLRAKCCTGRCPRVALTLTPEGTSLCCYLCKQTNGRRHSTSCNRSDAEAFEDLGRAYLAQSSGTGHPASVQQAHPSRPEPDTVFAPTPTPAPTPAPPPAPTPPPTPQPTDEFGLPLAPAWLRRDLQRIRLNRAYREERARSAQPEVLAAPTPPPEADPAPAPPPPAPVAPVARSRRRPRPAPTPADPAPAPAPAPAPPTASRDPRVSERSRRQLARQHQLEFENLGRLNDVNEEEMVAQVMALTAEPEGGSGSGQPSPTPTPAPAPTPTPAPAPTPTPPDLADIRELGPVPGLALVDEVNCHGSTGLSAPEDPDQVQPCSSWGQHRELNCECPICYHLRGNYTDADWDVDTNKRARTERSSVGSGDGTCSVELNPGWLGGAIKLQAIARRSIAGQ